MSEYGWKRDESPYLVFPCKKCHQFSYVKLTQKTKKCLRCGHMHLVNSLISTGKVVNGITNALELVKKKQEDFKGNPQFRADNSFKLVKVNENDTNKQNPQLKTNNQSIPRTESKQEKNLFIRFKKLLCDLGELHKYFPEYLIEIMADDYSIPKQEIPGLLRMMIKQGILGHSAQKDHYFLSKRRISS